LPPADSKAEKPFLHIELDFYPTDIRVVHVIAERIAAHLDLLPISQRPIRFSGITVFPGDQLWLKCAVSIELNFCLSASGNNELIGIFSFIPGPSFMHLSALAVVYSATASVAQ
jgi:hypothetical protein